MSKKFKMAERGKFKRENSRYSYQSFWMIETSLSQKKKKVTITLYFKRFNFNFQQNNFLEKLKKVLTANARLLQFVRV